MTGTGPGGRIVRDDIAALLTGAPRIAPVPGAVLAAAAVPSPAPATRTFDLPDRPAGVPREMSTIRRRTGQRMAESMRTAPHFYVTSEVDMGPRRGAARADQRPGPG